MHGPSLQARLVDIDHPRFPEHLGVAEAPRSADAQLMPPAEEPSDPFQHVPADSIICLAREAEAEVFGPSRQEPVEPISQLRPRGGLPRNSRMLIFSLILFWDFFEGRAPMNRSPGLPVPYRTEGVAQEVKRLFAGVTEARLGRVDRQAELLQPARHQSQAFFRLAAARAEDDEVISVRDDLAQPF